MRHFLLHCPAILEFSYAHVQLCNPTSSQGYLGRLLSKMAVVESPRRDHRHLEKESAEIALGTRLLFVLLLSRKWIKSKAMAVYWITKEEKLTRNAFLSAHKALALFKCSKKLKPNNKAKFDIISFTFLPTETTRSCFETKQGTHLYCTATRRTSSRSSFTTTHSFYVTWFTTQFQYFLVHVIDSNSDTKALAFR